jgi:hypothetical protein
MDNIGSQDERRKEENELHHPWQYKKNKIKKYLKIKKNNFIKNKKGE